MEHVISSEKRFVSDSNIRSGDQSALEFREIIASLITKGFAIVPLGTVAQKAIWSAIDGIDDISESQRQTFSFPDITDGFMARGGEHAKYTDNVDLCDRFCHWRKHRGIHRKYGFFNTPFYAEIVESENHLSNIAQQVIAGHWGFFQSEQKVDIRDSSYLQFCVYQNKFQTSDREYLQDRHEDGHLITLIKPNRDGLVVYSGNTEIPIHLSDNQLLIITGSMLTALSDGQILPLYHAVRNPMLKVSRKSLVYFVIPKLSEIYVSLLGKRTVNIASLADESHRAFGNTSLLK